MQFTVALLSAIAAISSVAAAPAPVEARADVTGPFALKIESANKTWNGQYLSNVHVGAAINLAVPGGSPDVHYYLNTTDGWTDETGHKVGLLTFDGNPNIPYSGGLQFDVTNNIAPLYISVLEPQYFSLSSKGHLLLDGLERWYICTVATAYGPKAGISWKLGNVEPSLPDCAAISLVKTRK